MRKSPILLVALLLGGCAVSTLSEQSGGFGSVVLRGVPVAGARVSIVDLGGTQTGVTDANGKFRIAGISRKRLHWLMENPVYHDVKLRIEVQGMAPVERSVRKSVFGAATVDFGRIEAGT
jgi:hypothetical protein